MKKRYTLSYKNYRLLFFKAARTSRDTLTFKDSYFIIIRDHEKNINGIGECAFIPGLSIDPLNNYEKTLNQVLLKVERELNLFELFDFNHIRQKGIVPFNYPSLLFALETAINDLKNGGNRTIFINEFTSGLEGISINGLVWMDTAENMLRQAIEKAESGFSCVKFKVGGLDFREEFKMLRIFRKQFPGIQIRLDANGAFSPTEAIEKLKTLSELNIHSIEQPIRTRQWKAMADICQNSPIPVALDEELIGINDIHSLLGAVYPQYIVLKPSLLGGFIASQKWIESAFQFRCGFWITSALESNIGLNAIAQWAFPYTKSVSAIEQGLGTGMLYKNNFPSPLEISLGRLIHNSAKTWGLDDLL